MRESYYSASPVLFTIAVTIQTSWELELGNSVWKSCQCHLKIGVLLIKYITLSSDIFCVLCW